MISTLPSRAVINDSIDDFDPVDIQSLLDEWKNLLNLETLSLIDMDTLMLSLFKATLESRFERMQIYWIK
ncbi:MAG: hypothetical protein RBR62_07055 [Bacteroidales bacterium]|nr:hypothetical protein [Bacteroidales bacterium]